MPLRIEEEEPGPTGKLSPGKIIAWFWMIVAGYVSLVYLGMVPHFGDVATCETVSLTFWRWIIASFTFGILSAGFYAGMAKGGFMSLVEALKKRIENAK